MNLDTLNIKLGNNLSQIGCYHTEVTGSHPRARGHGTDESQSISFLKAAHEYAERVAVLKYFENSDSLIRTSSGFSCHIKRTAAEKNAVLELLERDAFMSFWLEGRSPSWLEADDLLKVCSKNISEKCKVLLDLNFELKFSILAKYDSLHVVMGIISLVGSKSTGPVVATACGDTISNAVHRVFIDLVRSADLILARLSNGAELFRKISPEEIKRPEDHMELYLNPESWHGLDWFFVNSGNIPQYNIPKFQIETLEKCSELDWNHCIVRAHSNELQPIFFGQTDERYVNSKRKINLMNYRTHPLA